MNKLKIVLIAGIVAITSIASAATMSPSDFAVRQQMIDFAHYFPNLVSQYYPGYVSQNEPKLGSITGPDIPSPYLGFGGVRTYAFNAAISGTVASTSCSIQMPQATTTIMTATYNIYGISSTSPVAIGWSGSPNSTTTKISATTDIITSGPIVITASSSASTFIVPPGPNSYINFKIGGGAGFTVAPLGNCSVMLRDAGI